MRGLDLSGDMFHVLLQVLLPPKRGVSHPSVFAKCETQFCSIQLFANGVEGWLEPCPPRPADSPGNEKFAQGEHLVGANNTSEASPQTDES